jgi:hypothetical protein
VVYGYQTLLVDCRGSPEGFKNRSHAHLASADRLPLTILARQFNLLLAYHITATSGIRESGGCHPPTLNIELVSRFEPAVTKRETLFSQKMRTGKLVSLYTKYDAQLVAPLRKYTHFESAAAQPPILRHRA